MQSWISMSRLVEVGECVEMVFLECKDVEFWDLTLGLWPIKVFVWCEFEVKVDLVSDQGIWDVFNKIIKLY